MNLLKSQKKREEERIKLLETKIRLIKGEVDAILDKNNVKIISYLEYTAAGVFPRWTFVNNEERRTD